MKLKYLRLFNFRNYKSLDFIPGENINVLYGLNASGKTNLLESIYMSIRANSFRNQKDRDLINIGENSSSIITRYNIENFKDDYRVEISNFENKKLFINDEKVNTKEYRKSRFVVLFSPEDLNMIKYSPKDRRKFLDDLLSNIDLNYDFYMYRYRKLLFERNKLLKSCTDKNLLDVYDREIVKNGTKIIIMRLKTIKKLNEIAKKHYKNISGDDLNITYLSTVPILTEERELTENYLKLLKSSLSKDIEKKYTTIGPHRDDLDFKINKYSSKSYGSQGEQRSIVLSLKLSEADLIKELYKTNPILLLDDVFSEIDSNRSRYLLYSLKNLQTFITTTETSNFLKSIDANFYRINAGKILY
ncbi:MULTISPECIES: DNA replication/repair protein RecF [Peptoniphilus]|uniref:DNA replication/repair protein RecF n=1 Tax=Peptoniphilus TaxID=162289 RepID=UPI0008DA5CFF|nr:MULTISPECIES: DNA replication/repair protein RecF [Peptoniphilus]MBS6610853.1 DNA replication/repair protein RecF [Peptoniphilus harei]MDU1043131.1 DNA replication/repair protein RecF [Peptoniphilus rhinitidis]MDU2110128.1 DNA replication/repair protein RecF [Peptoniphilus lacydonensis]MDU2114864.1 DNA replication/repair protein RecF [Peptoniphilus lacydonensis]MDU5274497.1 DNA replication/repair protein RecF [Peptoniphilus lacydonensis]